MNLLWKLLRRHMSAIQLTGYWLANLAGMAIILLALQFGRDLLPIFTAPDSFLRSDYLILSKKVGTLQAIGLGSSDFTPQELDNLQKQPFTRRLGTFLPATYHITGTIAAGGMELSSELFFESVPDEFIDVRSEHWKFQPGDRTIPIILPRNYLNLYNYGFAKSQGLPQLAESIFKKVSLGIDIVGNGREEHFEGRIVGFSDRLNTILVPRSFIEWSNAEFSDQPHTSPARLILDAANPADPQLATYLDRMGYETEGGQQSGKTAHFLQLITIVVITIGGIITALSFFILMLSIFLLLQKNSRKLENLLLLGYTPAQVSRPYQWLTLGLNGSVLLIAIGLLCWSRHLYLPSLENLWNDYTPAGIGITSAIGIGVMIAVTLLNSLAIRRKISRLWDNR